MLTRVVVITSLLLLAGLPAAARHHTADTNADQQIAMSELLRVIQLFNSGEFHCETGTEDGYAPDAGDRTCAPHDSDYSPHDWRIRLSEVLRLIQLLNSGGYHTECGTEDDFALGLGAFFDCRAEGESNTETIFLPGDVALEMVWISSGSFMMGRYSGEQDSYSAEDPQHLVTVPGFWLGKYEVTQAQWRAIMGTNPSHFSGDNRPVEAVSWNYITQTFLPALNTATGLTFRLPSESEWEYAVRAGTATRFYWGDDLGCTNIGPYAWYSGNSGSQTHGVGTAGGTGHPNAFGLYDMSGNVWEWCQDWYHLSYTGAPVDGSAWALPTNSYRVARGGGWGYDGLGCRSALRSFCCPGCTSHYVGFRLAR